VFSLKLVLLTPVLTGEREVVDPDEALCGGKIK
jgi:hypothetical protein